MSKEVIVKVIGTQKSPDGEVSTIEQTNRGTFAIQNDKKYLLYYEQSEENGEQVKNLVTIGTNEVIVSKSGAITTRMTFAKGKRYGIAYKTQFGEMLLDIFTKNLMIEEREDYIKITVDYNLELDSEVVSYCTISIECPENKD